MNGRSAFTVDDLVAIADVLGLTLVELLQMPKNRPIGGGTNLHGLTPIRGGLKKVGPEGLEPPTVSVKPRHLTLVPDLDQDAA